MLLIKTKLKSSSIEGLGVFAEEFVPTGTKIGEWDDNLDRTIPINYVLSLNPTIQNTLFKYAYKEGKYYKLNTDNMRFFNHSNNPNTKQEMTSDWATKDIQIGEEITCNYFSFDEDAENKLM